MLYLAEVFNNGVNVFLILIVVIFDKILESVSSTNSTIFEYLKTLSNFSKFVDVWS